MKPLDLEINVSAKNVLGIFFSLLLSITATIFASIHFQDILNFFFPDSHISWYLVYCLIALFVVITFLIMHHIWKKEYDAHQKTRYEKENLEIRLTNSEKRRLIDLITGIPNRVCLEKEIEKKFSKSNERIQIIFIDLKRFGEINNKYGQYKANQLLREIAQTIYTKMRRNEEMYKCPLGDSKTNMYRVYPGGDEFAFVIFGDQSDAIGFSNRLVGLFDQISKKTNTILGNEEKLSFSCGIVEMEKGDTYSDIEQKIDPCYINAKAGTKNKSTIYWFPITIEKEISDNRKKNEYSRARELFEVMTPDA